MKCKRPRAYIFSDQAVNYLGSFGFNVVIEEMLDHGYRRVSIPLIGPQGEPSALEFIEILDEVLYFAQEKEKKIVPSLLVQEVLEGESVAHPNGVFKWSGSIDSSSMQLAPWNDFLRLAKSEGLVAIILECKDINLVKSFNFFHREFVFQSHAYGLIHLGPSSFDLLIKDVFSSE